MTLRTTMYPSVSAPAHAAQAGLPRPCARRPTPTPPRSRRALPAPAAKKPGFGDELLDFVLGERKGREMCLPACGVGAN